jgi:IS30 family transposase
MKANHSITQISDQLGRHKSTISHELGRNEGSRGYRPKQASELALSRSQGSRNARELEPWVKRKADFLLGLQWSPEQIAGKLPVSPETLYLHVYADKVNGGKLWKNLRCQKQKRKRYADGQDRRGQIPNRRPLSERPAHVEDLKHLGHWEGDTVIGTNHKQDIVSEVERKSGYAVIEKVANKTADLVSAAIVKRLKPFSAKVNILRFDNGKEFCGHGKIAEALGRTSYFARPFASFERGSNENFNGLLRQYVPEKRAIESITDEEIRMIENRLNNRTRKRLGFRTPSREFHQSLSLVARRP